MRGIRAVLLAALLAGALGLAGCSDDSNKKGASGSGSSGSSGSSSSAPASPGAGASTDPSAPGQVPPAEGGGTATGSDKQVCADQEKLVADSTRKFGEAVVKAATGEGGEQATVAAVKTLFSEWASGMRAQAGKAQSPELKSALTDYAAGLDKVNSQINGIGDLDKLGDLNNGDIETATDRILAICG